MRVLRKREGLIIMTKQRQIVHRINDLSHSKKGKCTQPSPNYKCNENLNRQPPQIFSIHCHLLQSSGTRRIMVS
jgi:hypothetical protein